MKSELRKYLRTRLAEYAAGVRALAGHLETGSKKWMLFSAAAGATVAATSTADAAVIYSGIRNVRTGPSLNMPGHRSIDIDGDGTGDLGMYIF